MAVNDPPARASVPKRFAWECSAPGGASVGRAVAAVAREFHHWYGVVELVRHGDPGDLYDFSLFYRQTVHGKRLSPYSLRKCGWR